MDSVVLSRSKSVWIMDTVIRYVTKYGVCMGDNDKILSSLNQCITYKCELMIKSLSEFFSSEPRVDDQLSWRQLLI